MCEALEAERFNEDEAVEWDMKGPEKAPLRLWVHLHDYRDKRNAVGIRKGTELEGQMVKKPKEADIQRMNKSLTVNHGIEEHGFNLQHLGAGMTKSGGGGEAFNHINVIGSVTALAPEEQSENEEDENDKDKGGDEGEQDKEELDYQSPEDKKKGKATDIDRLRLTVQKMLLARVDKLKEAAETTRSTVRSHVLKVEGLEVKHRAFLRGEEALARARLHALDLVFGQDVQLKAWIQDRCFSRDPLSCRFRVCIDSQVLALWCLL